MKVTFDSQGDKVVGILSNPSGDVNNTIVILCHGLKSNKECSTCAKLEKNLNGRQTSTLRFDFFAHGESEGKFEDLTVSKAVNNILAAVEFLISKGYTRIGLFGSSFGGLASLIAAMNINGLLFLALKCPVSRDLSKLISDHTKTSLDRWKEKGFLKYTDSFWGDTRLNYEFARDADQYNNLDYSEINVTTLIVHGDQDKDVPLEQSIKTSEQIPDCELKIFRGADHSFKNGPYFQKMIESITKFILDNSNNKT